MCTRTGLCAGVRGVGHTAIDLGNKPVVYGVYASERLSLRDTGKVAEGQSWSPTGLARGDCPG